MEKVFTEIAESYDRLIEEANKQIEELKKMETLLKINKKKWRSNVRAVTS